MKITGEMFALLTALSWAGSALVFGKITKEFNTQVSNFIRVFTGTILIGFICLLGKRNLFLPTDVTFYEFKYIALSGFIGMFLGDLFLFKAYNIIGARVTMLIMSLSPLIVFFIDVLFLGTPIKMMQLFAILITCFGIIMVILKPIKGRYNLSFSTKGLIYAFLATLGQSLGVIFTKIGSESYDSLATTQIRLGVAIFCFGIMIILEKKYKEIMTVVTNFRYSILFLAGTCFSVFGVITLVEAFKISNAAVASTISSTSPILIIPFSILLYKETIKKNEIIGSIVAILGISIFFLF